MMNDNYDIKSTFLGKIASDYYMDPKSIKFLDEKLNKKLTIWKLLLILSHVEEYSEVPVRHHEDEMNMVLNRYVPFKIEKNRSASPKAKTFLLFQAYFANLPLPIRDYITDMKLILDSSFRIIASMIDICAYKD